ncbi:PadR family transcriptional regulator [Alkalicoccobacillus murimartini]
MYKEPLHGYGIIKEVLSLTNEMVELAPGTLYGVLKKLEKQSYIVTLKEEAMRNKKTYAITENGIKILELEYLRYKNLIEFSKMVIKD